MGAPQQATIRYVAGQRTCLVNLPMSLCGQLVERGIPPQNIVVALAKSSKTGQASKHVFVGWTGALAGVTGYETAHKDALEIDPVLARELHLREGEKVPIVLHSDVASAKHVNVSPVTSDDWEIIEIHSDFIEQHLLAQVRAASIGQIICVWVGKSRTLVRFIVGMRFIFPESQHLLDALADSYAPSNERVVRFTNETEVIVAPRLRAKPTQTFSDGESHGPQGQQKVEPLIGRRLFRLLPTDSLARPSVSDAMQTEKRIAVASPRDYETIVSVYSSSRCAVRLAARPRTAAISNKAGSVVHDDNLLSSVVAVHSHPSIPEHHLWVSDAVSSDLQLPALGRDGSNRYHLIRLMPHPIQSKLAGVERDARQEHVVRTTQHSPKGKQRWLAETSNGPLFGNGVELPLIGIDRQLDSACAHLLNCVDTKTPGFPTAGLLICGPAGSGKTSFARELGHRMATHKEFRAHVQWIDCSKLTEDRPQVLKDKWKEWIDDAYWHAPSLLILDNIDRMIPAEVEHIDPFRSQHVAALFVEAIRNALCERPLLTVATSQSSTSLHALLITKHMFVKRLSLRAPDKLSRRQILEKAISCRGENVSINAASTIDYVALATQTEGYMPSDLLDLVNAAFQQATIRSSGGEKPPKYCLRLIPDDFAAAQLDIVPVSLRDMRLQKTDVHWADIGGLRSVKKLLRETLEWPTKFAAIFAKCPLRLRSGLLLYGFPGCGKTLLASAVAKECGLNFISVKGPEILNKYIGASEKSVRDLFDRAQAAKPCVLFFDEFDSIAPKRGHDSTGVTDRVVNQMLTQMDGAEGLDGVYVLAATSRPDLVDPALLRPGRLDKSILCSMPDIDERADIMRACSRKLTLTDDVDMAAYAVRTNGFTGADLQALVYNAHLDALHAKVDHIPADLPSDPVDSMDREHFVTGPDLQAGATSGVQRTAFEKRLRTVKDSAVLRTQGSEHPESIVKSTVHVSSQNFSRALQKTRASMPASELVRLQRIYDAFAASRNQDAGLPSGESSANIGGRTSLM